MKRRLGREIEMGIPRSGRDGTYITSRVGRGSHVVKTIVTPAGRFRTISKDVFDRAMRSANSALKRGERPFDHVHDDVRER